MLQVLMKRLPNIEAILPVYAILVFILYGWETIAFFWKVPAWLFYLGLGEVGVIYSYGVVNEFVESLAYLILLLMLAAILPASILKEKFQTRATLIALFLLGSVYLISYLIAFQEVERVKAALFTISTGMVLDILLLWLSAKFAFLERAIIFLTNQVTIFLYVYAPITAIALVVILIRNLG